MSPDGIQTAFFEIYRHPSCHPMCQTFEWAYRARVESEREVAAASVADAA